MAGSNCYDMFCKSPVYYHRRNAKRFPHSRTGSINAKKRDIHFSQPKRRRHQLPQQVARHHISDIFFCNTCMADCQTCSLFLKLPFCFFPSISPNFRVCFNFVKIFPIRPFAFLFSYNGCRPTDYWRIFKTNTLFSNLFTTHIKALVFL